MLLLPTLAKTVQLGLWTNTHTHTQLFVPHTEPGGREGSEKATSAVLVDWSGTPHPRVYPCKLFFHTRLLDRPRHGVVGLVCTGGDLIITGGPEISYNCIQQVLTSGSGSPRSAAGTPRQLLAQYPDQEKWQLRKSPPIWPVTSRWMAAVMSMSRTWVVSPGWEQQQISDLVQAVCLPLVRGFIFPRLLGFL